MKIPNLDATTQCLEHGGKDHFPDPAFDSLIGQVQRAFLLIHTKPKVRQFFPSIIRISFAYIWKQSLDVSDVVTS